MKKISYQKMADTIIAKRKAQNLTQAQLGEMTGINRGMISRLEGLDYLPSIDQLQAIAEALEFEITDLFEEDKPASDKTVLDKKYNIAVAGTGYMDFLLLLFLHSITMLQPWISSQRRLNSSITGNLQFRMIISKCTLLKKNWILLLP